MDHPNTTYSAGGIITDKHGKVILICENGNFWGLPKGRIEKDEDALSAAIREVKEEAGIDELELLALLGKYNRHPFTFDNVEDKSELKVIQMYLFRSKQTEMRPTEENSEPVWLTIQEAGDRLTHPADKKFFLSVESQIKEAQEVMQYLYLFTLEITPLEVGRTYDELPSHLTLMSRFMSDLAAQELTSRVRLLFMSMTPPQLRFNETIKIGPKQVTAHMVTSADEKTLHEELRILLDEANVDYQYPQFIGDGHKPHVTVRDGARFEPGDEHTVKAAYLIEVVNGRRVIRSRFELNDMATSHS